MAEVEHGAGRELSATADHCARTAQHTHARTHLVNALEPVLPDEAQALDLVLFQFVRDEERHLIRRKDVRGSESNCEHDSREM